MQIGGGLKDRDVKFVRNVPKFLKGHMHLLGRKEEPDEDDEEADELPTIEEAVKRRKVEDNSDDDDAENQVSFLQKCAIQGAS